MDTPDIKIITGVRRAGKSTLLTDFKHHVRRQEPEANLISINFNQSRFQEIMTADALGQYVKTNYRSRHHNLVLIDEVQMCEGFERAINSLHESGKFDLYLTGSNAFLSASNLATLFAGRTFTIPVFPFSFAEYLSYFRPSDHYQAFSRYAFDDGGLAGSYIYDTFEEKRNYLSEVYNAAIIRDIITKYKIKNEALLYEVNDFLMDNISNLTSTRTITNTLNSQGRHVSHTTIGDYLSYLCEVYAFYRVRRYDIQGKRYLASQDKYYLADHTFKYARLGRARINYGRVLENIVAVELLRRGYEVYVGTLGKTEVDFVALQRGEKVYIQVAYDISLESTLERELAPFFKIKDNYPKILITRLSAPAYFHDGIKVIDIADWLTGPSLTGTN